MIGIVLIGAVFFALLELNRNSLWGWVLAFAVFAGFYFLRRRVLSGRSLFLRLSGWFGFLAVLAAVLFLSQGPYRLHPAVSGRSPAVTDPVTIKQGQLTGVVTDDGAVEVYAGIPYARPPLNELRWKEPQDPEPWEGVLRADHFAPMSMQPSSGNIYNSLAQIIGYHDFRISLQDNFRDRMSEDSLYLNIWKPSGKVQDAPVLVYIHGGSLMTGQPWYADYSGEGLARSGIIAVNMGYRLGVFGFLADPELAEESPNGTTGNYGLLDQIKALEWVRDNIAAFGGDPENVTLAGESAGSVCVSALCTSPLARGLFRRAVGESSTAVAPHPAHSYRSLEEAFDAGRMTRERTGAATLEELRRIPAEQLVSATEWNHHITVDGYVLPESPNEAYRKGIHNEEAILHGYNRTEGKLFLLFDRTSLRNYPQKVRDYFGTYSDRVLSLYPAADDAEARSSWEEIYSAIFFSYGHACWTEQALRSGTPVYEYWFTKDNGRLGANHSGEEVYFYGNIPEDSKLYNESDRTLGAVMHDYFCNFIRAGDPNGEGLPHWEKLADPGQVQELGIRIGPADEKACTLHAILDQMQEADSGRNQASPAE